MRKKIQNRNKIFHQVIFVLLTAAFILSPSIANAQSSSSTARTPGTPTGSYKLSDTDTVNLFTGNLNYTLPLLNIGGRGEAQAGLGIVIEGQWDMRETHPDPVHTMHEYSFKYPNPLAFVGRVEFEVSINNAGVCGGSGSNAQTWRATMTYVEADGTQHTLRDTVLRSKPIDLCGYQTINLGNLFESSSGSFLTFVTDAPFCIGASLPSGCTNNVTGYLFFRNGTRSRVIDGRIIWTQDRNGNKIEYTYETSYYARLTKIKDSIGREVNIEYNVNEPSPYGRCTKVSYDGFGGGEQNKKIIRISHETNYANLLRTTQQYDTITLVPIEQDDPNDDILVGTGGSMPDFIKAVWLPDGRSYQFKYNILGQLARVELPTGGAVEYDFADISQVPFPAGSRTAPGPTTNRMKEKRIYNNNNVLVNKVKFSIPTSYAGSFPQNRDGVVRDVVQFDPNGNLLGKTRHYFYGAPNAEYGFLVPWWHGKEFRSEVFDFDGTTLLRINEQDWRQRDPSWCYNNAYYSSWAMCGSNPSENAPISNPFVVESKSTLIDGNLVSKTSAVNPVTGQWAFDNYNNQTGIWQYDFGIGQPGNLIKHTQISFNNYYTPGTFVLLSLTNTTSVYAVDSNGQETLASSSQIVYDEYSQYPLLTYNSIMGWQDPGSIRGNPTTVKQWLNTNNSWIETHAQFDQLGNVRKSWDALGRVSETSYTDAFTDSVNRNTYAFPTQTISPIPDPSSVTNGVHGSTTPFVSSSVYDYYSGLVKSTTDINGQTSYLEYNDPLNRLTKAISPNGAWVAYEYGDTIGNLYVKTRLTFDETKFLESYSFFDGLGRSVRSAKLDGEGTWITADTQYDAAGRVWRVSNPYHASGLYGAVNPPNIWTTNQYDALSRTVKITAADGSESTMTYYANTVTVQDAAGKKRKTVSDSLGRLSQVIEDPTGLNLTTNYKYDILGNMRMVEQGQQRRYYMYDSLSRLIRSRNPEQDANTNHNLYDPISDNSQWATAFEYASNGNMLAKIDARGVRIEYCYDNLNRLYKRHYVTTQTPPAGTYTATPDDEYFYDGKGLVSTLNFALGKMTKAYSTLSETKYTQFDSMGRVLSSEQVTDGQTYQMSYKYNLSGALISQIYPSGREVKNFFDSAGDLSTVSGRVPTRAYKMYASNIDYDFTNIGATSQVQLGNGRWESTEFNKRLQPTQIALGTTQNGTNLLKLNFDYGTSNNNNGNMLSQTITVPTVGQNPGFTAVQNYTYDGLNRLSSATETSNSSPSWQQTFTYDRYGNRQVNTSATTTSLIGDNPLVSETNNQITPRTGEQYLYDSAGNLIRDKAGNLFSYNGENQQTTYTPAGSSQPTAFYIYDSYGRRVKKISGNETTVFVYNGLGQMVAEYAINAPVPQNPTTSYLTTDNLGTPRINTDSIGNVQARHDYLPFGEEINRLGGRNANNGYQSDSIRQKYTGYQRDTESGLDFAQARYYASLAGRFTSVDPLMASAKTTNPQTFNRYSYALNSPYKFTDPLGLAATNPQCGNGGRCDTQADDLAQQQKEQEQKQKEQQQQSEQKKVDCPQKGYCLVYQEIGKQQTLSGDIVNGKPAYGVQRTFIFRIFKDGTPLTPSTAKGVTVEENVVKTEAFVLNPTTGKREPAPKEITDTVKDEKTDGPQALFTKEGKQTGDVQAFAATTKDKYDELAGTGLMSKDEVKFTVRVDGKEVASRTIISTKTLTNISVEIKPNIQPK